VSRGRLWAVVTPLAFGVVFLVLWQLFVVTRNIKPYFLPKPSAIWSEFVANRDQEWKTAKVSGLNALVGLVFGTAIGLVAALVASRFRAVSELLTPLSVAVNAVPIIVLTSVFYAMFAATSETPRRLMATCVVFFVVFVNVTRGLTQTSSTQVELMRSYAASPSAVMRKVRVPNALPYFFTALRIAAPLSVITAFVAEYFGGTQDGLGYRITSSIANSRTATAWAYVSVACLLGLLSYLGALVLERLVMPWRARQAA
jgi:NitT/TauT family transport system permease protein